MTGLAILKVKGNLQVIHLSAYKNLYDAIKIIIEHKPYLVGIDAPLTTPYKGFRPAEKLLIKCGKAKLLPGGLPSMRKLTILGNSILHFLIESGIIPVETHPTTILKNCEEIRNLTYTHCTDKDSCHALASALAAYYLCTGRSVIFIDDKSFLVHPLC
jgi:predicted nuclease with RNAse H fold